MAGVKALLRPLAHGLDRRVADVSLRLGGEGSGLLAFMFHSLFADRREAEAGLVDPFQPVTVADFRAFIDYFLSQGYRFVAPEDLLSGLDPAERYAFITFDDGYANNLRALPVLREFDVPATFFISANHVIEGRGYWWDALYRERLRQGRRADEIEREQEALKAMPHQAIESRLREVFGAEVLWPEGEADRPMTEAELVDFGRDPRVTLGNHTVDHAILTVYDSDEGGAQIEACQRFLAGITGAEPTIIAYPNGNHDARVVSVARERGLKLGAVTEPRRTPLPLSGEASMTIGRYAINGGPGLRGQCRSCQSAVQLIHGTRRLRRRLRAAAA
ncbi:MAG: polysaccharide deacetylase family protein [Kiloniellales bacterium]|nr:polysaccharide deacetylase family protein [Kiloniellales bacterium]